MVKAEKRLWFVPLRHRPFKVDRPLTEIVCSGSFWRGFADGFAPERYFAHRGSYYDLAELDTVRYAWDSVGNCLNEAIHDFSVGYERESGIRFGEGVEISDARANSGAGHNGGGSGSCECHEPSSLANSG